MELSLFTGLDAIVFASLTDESLFFLAVQIETSVPIQPVSQQAIFVTHDFYESFSSTTISLESPYLAIFPTICYTCYVSNEGQSLSVSVSVRLCAPLVCYLLSGSIALLLFWYLF